jgi:hypothetical protein
MSWSYEIAMRGAPEAAAGLRQWLSAGPRQALTRLPGLASLDLYTPAEGLAHDPYNHDASGPLMMLMLHFASRDALANAVKNGALANAHGSFPDGVEATGAAFERQSYPIGDAARPAPLEAPFSYVVRYHLPADDDAAFIANYIATHPTTQAKLPGIRGIMCYLPLHDVVTAAGNVASANYLIGNEVVFDDIAAFNVAMASPVRQELRAHYHEFPSFSGGNTHYPMARTRLAG